MLELTLIQKITVWALPLIFAITLHEVAHGFIAYLLGDSTAKFSGRLTINPLKHIDPIGTVVVPLLMLSVSNFIFGWAKPVPVDERNLRNPKRDMAFVALAGPASNLLMALGWALVAKLGVFLQGDGNTWAGVPLLYMGEAGIIINVVLGVLNLIPLPPLDGGRIFLAILPKKAAYTYSQIEPYGFFILLALILTGWLSNIMGPFVYFFIDNITNLVGLN